MPRREEYWARRNKGFCVECSARSVEHVRCDVCQAKKLERGRVKYASDARYRADMKRRSLERYYAQKGGKR